MSRMDGKKTQTHYYYEKTGSLLHIKSIVFDAFCTAGTLFFITVLLYRRARGDSEREQAINLGVRVIKTFKHESGGHEYYIITTVHTAVGLLSLHTAYCWRSLIPR